MAAPWIVAASPATPTAVTWLPSAGSTPPAASSGARVNIGGVWVLCEVYVNDGTSWVLAAPKVNDGTTWVASI